MYAGEIRMRAQNAEAQSLQQHVAVLRSALYYIALVSVPLHAYSFQDLAQKRTSMGAFGFRDFFGSALPN